jgi:hypothetical protein
VADRGFVTLTHQQNVASPFVTSETKCAQYFIPTDDYQVTELAIWLFVPSPLTWNPGPLTVSLNNAVDGFEPTSFVRGSGQIAQGDLVTGWNTVTLNAVSTVNTNGNYAILANFGSATEHPPSGLQEIKWFGSAWDVQQTTDYYPGACWLHVRDSTGWTELDNGVNFSDRAFQVYGVDIGVVLPPGPAVGFPTSRPSGYNPNFHWQPGVWAGGVYTGSFWDTSYVATGGGRWGQQLVVAGNKQIWYEELA